MIWLECPLGHWATYAAVADRVRGGGANIVVIVVVGHAHVLLLNQLLGTLDLVQGDTLGGPSSLPHALSMCLPLRFALFITHRWHKGSTGLD